MNGESINDKDIETIKDDILYKEYHSYSYLTLKELLDFDYNQTFEDRRSEKITYFKEGGILYNGNHIVEEGEGISITYKDHLGESFFEHIEILKTLGEPENVRIVFYFDN
jgi:hypothetical protein